MTRHLFVDLFPRLDGHTTTSFGSSELFLQLGGIQDWVRRPVGRVLARKRKATSSYCTRSVLFFFPFCYFISMLFGSISILFRCISFYFIRFGSVLGPYSPTILKNVLSLVLQIFLFLHAFECNTTSDWLNHMV